MEDIQVNACNFIIFKYLAMFWLVYILYSESAEKEIEMKQNEVYGINTRPLQWVQRIRLGILLIIAIMYNSDSKILATC